MTRCVLVLLLTVVSYGGAVAETIAAGGWRHGGDDVLALLQTHHVAIPRASAIVNKQDEQATERAEPARPPEGGEASSWQRATWDQQAVSQIQSSRSKAVRHAAGNTSAAQLILHVGPPKTGSTTIQSVTQDMSDSLRKDGIEVLISDDFIPVGSPVYPNDTNSYMVAVCFDPECDTP
jgi:hypothetical protein